VGTRTIGRHLKLHTSDDHGAKVSDHLMISSHGLKMTSRTTEFEVPEDVTVKFYGPDHFFLNDPGLLKMMWGMMAVYEDNGPGSMCPNYALSKFQRYHGGSDFLSIVGSLTKFSTLADKIRQRRPNYIEPDDWETYTGINSIYNQEQPEALVDLRGQIQDNEHSLASFQGRLRELLENPSEEKGRDEFMSRLWTDQVQSRTATAQRMQARLDVLNLNLERHPMDVLTIRHRMTPTTVFHTVTLQEVIATLRQNGLRYQEIHCSFCRGSISDFFREKLRGVNRSYDANDIE
jgi:hypothetical protein